MPRVYIVNNGGHDYSDAIRYGELVFCTEGTVNKFNTSQMVRQFTEAFRDSEPEDYIVLTSLSIMCSIACSIFARKHGRLNLLIFKFDESGKGGYVERTVVFDPQEEIAKLSQ